MAFLRAAICQEREASMTRIPITRDVAELVGDFGEGVQNRGLLLDKFVFHKDWGLDGLRANDAHRWTLMRISDGGAEVLHSESSRRKNESRGRDREEHNRVRLENEAEIAAKLASTRVETEDARRIRAAHSRRFVGLMKSAFGNRAILTIAQLQGRLAINLADSLIQNAGICLDRLFGLPFIPGSAVKGVCRHAALRELKAADNNKRSALFRLFHGVFGTSDNDFEHGDLRVFRDHLSGAHENQKGAISFLPAYPVNEARVVVDLTNVHYLDYYRTGRQEDLSNERPQPNPFPAVEAGAQFAFCLALNGINNDAALLDCARRWLEEALTVSGLGAKTASGYGWFSLRPDILEKMLDDERREAAGAASKLRQEAEAKAKEKAAEARLKAMMPEEQARERFKAMAAEEFAKAVSGIASLLPHDQKGLILALLTPEKKDTWKAWKKSDKPANKARVEAALAAARVAGVSLP